MQEQSQTSQNPKDPGIPSALSAEWRADYHPAADAYDEVYSGPGTFRPHWDTFIKQFDTLGEQELNRRWEQARRLIHENGVTYNVYGNPQGMNRTWDLDALPLLISAEEWKHLERGLVQRATLINEILADLYGEQKLLHKGLLPPELIFAHPGFLRACHRLPVHNRQHLTLYSVDIGRGADGRFLAIADRTQSPAGAGYVLENRIVFSRIFPDVFKACHIQRLALFFRRMRQTLTSLAPHNRDNPRIVLLTPGPFNETYFEHAYLARYLNYTLVEGGDLTVRDGCLYWKTLGGLHRVDVLLRRLDDDFCDPLELRPDSSLGVAGLVEAVRAGNLAVANPLGTGLLETPALNAFLPSLARHLLNDDLILPTVSTFWCGKPEWLSHVVANIQKMVIKPTYPGTAIEPVYCGHLSADERSALVNAIKANPTAYVAQEQVALSTVPVWHAGKLQPRQAALRTYLVAADKTFDLMPGGLTQILREGETLMFSLQHSSGSKDTWVQASGPISDFSMLQPAGQNLAISRGGSDLPSRVADNLFWLGRYVERAESMVRLLRTILVRLSDKSVSLDVHELPILMFAFKHQRLRAEHFNPEKKRAVQADELGDVLKETFSPGGLYETLGLLQSVARTVRDRLSNDAWRVILSLDESVWPKGRNERIHEQIARLNFMLTTLASFGGLASESMTRGQVWRFVDMGRRLERAINLARFVCSTMVKSDVAEGSLLEAVLEVADSLMTYRRRYLASLQLAPIIDLLLIDQTNPRSMAFQLEALGEHVKNLPGDSRTPFFTQQEKIVFGATASLRLIDLDAVCKPAAETGIRRDLEALLVKLETDMGKLSDLITRDYLSHAQSSRQLATFSREGAF